VIGVVKAYDPKRGKGALTPDGGGVDVAVFASEVERADLAGLASGVRLSFDVKVDQALGRRFAVNLQVL
jgi:cold shock CspA family protein